MSFFGDPITPLSAEEMATQRLVLNHVPERDMSSELRQALHVQRRMMATIDAALSRVADLEAQICQAVEDGEMSLNSERRGMLNKRSVDAGESCGLCGFALAYTGPKPVHRIASIPETTHAFRADGSELHVGDVVACGERYREESIGFVHHGIVIETRST